MVFYIGSQVQSANVEHRDNFHLEIFLDANGPPVINPETFPRISIRPMRIFLGKEASSFLVLEPWAINSLANHDQRRNERQWKIGLCEPLIGAGEDAGGRTLTGCTIPLFDSL